MRGAVSVLSVFFACSSPAVLVAASLTACGGGEPSELPDAAPDSAPVDGTASFNEKIRPLVRQCINCHGVGLTMPNLTSFLALEARYKVKPGRLNVLVTKADNAAGMHYGILYFDVDEKKIVADWIDSLPNP